MDLKDRLLQPERPGGFKPRESSEKILIVDDADMVLKLEEILLKRTGCEVIKARNGIEALKRVQEERPRVVLLDIIMPEMNGDVVCKFIKSNPALKDISVIIVTSRGDEETRDRCARSGCDSYFTKPIEHQKLLEAVQGYLSVKNY
ncbi:MAG: response regulator [Proteobacteria bacterium]|nr:response regulator [Pseudomonadota bacterium]